MFTIPENVFTEDIRPVPRQELDDRLARFRRAMEQAEPGWGMAVLAHKVAMYYFTGTIQDGILVIRPQDAVLWVRRSFTRAQNESAFPDIRPMHSFREAAAFYAQLPQKIYLETKRATLDWEQRLAKYFGFTEVGALDGVLQDIRMLKSPYELEQMRISGHIHAEVLDGCVIPLVREGISEAELGSSIYKEMLVRGSQGLARFNMAAGDETIGITAFGRSGLVQTAFDGPGGIDGTCIAVQNIGSAFRYLKQNRLVYLDIPCGFDGYHTDKTVVYYFGDLNKDKDKEKILAAHNYCLEMEQEVIARLRPGKTLEQVYDECLQALGTPYGESFMGGAKFLGHGIGLVIDEAPVIAHGFKQEVLPGMTFAIEPKVALPGIGMVGTENSYVVGEKATESLTGPSHALRIING